MQVRASTAPEPQSACQAWEADNRRRHTRARPNHPRRRTPWPQKAQTYNGYCVKCKEKRDFEGTVEVTKTGMNMAKGKCPVCGTTVNRILGKGLTTPRVETLAPAARRT